MRGPYQASSLYRLRTPQNTVKKQSEESWRCPKRDLMRLRKVTTRPGLTPERRTNPCQDLYLYPFSDRFKALDFSHFRAKRVGYARHRSRLKEVSEWRTLPPQMV